MAIVSFANTRTRRIFERQRLNELGPDLTRMALKKLVMVHAAVQLDDLRLPPGNRLEAMSGDRIGQHSVRVDDQFRLCFRWDGRDAHDVELVDDH